MTQQDMNILSQSSQHMGVIATDQTGVITVFNTAAEQLLGYPAKSVIGKTNVLSLMTAEMNDLDSLTQLATQQSTTLHDQPLKLANGEHASFSLSISTIPDPKQQFTGILLMLSKAEPSEFSVTDLLPIGIFKIILAREFKRVQRSELPISLLHIRIDKTNDLETINTIALILQERIQRAGDVLAHAGNADFLILLPQTDKSGAVKLAEKIRLLVHHSKLPADFQDQTQRMSISVGIVTLHPSSQDEVNDLLTQAEQALQQAIEDGGNCSRLAAINCSIT